MHCNPDFPVNFLPVDVCANAIIAATWERGLAHDSKGVEYRNIVSFYYIDLHNCHALYVCAFYHNFNLK